MTSHIDLKYGLRLLIVISLLAFAHKGMAVEYMYTGEGGSVPPTTVPPTSATKSNSSIQPASSSSVPKLDADPYCNNNSCLKAAEPSVPPPGLDIDTGKVGEKITATGTVLESFSNETLRLTGKQIGAVATVVKVSDKGSEIYGACSGEDKSHCVGKVSEVVWREGQDAAGTATCAAIGEVVGGCIGGLLAGPVGAVVGVNIGATLGAVGYSVYKDDINSLLAPPGYTGLDKAGGDLLKNVVKARAEQIDEWEQKGIIHNTSGVMMVVPQDGDDFLGLKKERQRKFQQVRDKNRRAEEYRQREIAERASIADNNQQTNQGFFDVLGAVTNAVMQGQQVRQTQQVQQQPSTASPMCVFGVYNPECKCSTPGGPGCPPITSAPAGSTYSPNGGPAACIPGSGYDAKTCSCTLNPTDVGCPGAPQSGGISNWAKPSPKNGCGGNGPGTCR